MKSIVLYVSSIYLMIYINTIWGDCGEYFLKMSQLIIFYSLCYNWIIQLIAVKNSYFEILNIITHFLPSVLVLVMFLLCTSVYEWLYTFYSLKSVHDISFCFYVI